MKKRYLVLLSVVGFCVGSAGMAQATLITPGNARWYTFYAGLAGSPNAFAVGAFNAIGDYPGDPPWTYTGASEVKITDSFSTGDMFRLYDNGMFIGDTSTVSNATAIGTNNPNPDADFLDPLLSHGLFALGGGPHSLTIEIIQNAAPPNNEAIGYFRVDPVAPVPEPSTIVLLGLGLAGLAGLRGKFNTKTK